MAQLRVDQDQLHVQLSLTEKMIAVHGSIDLNLEHVDRAEPYGGTPKVRDVVRFSGTYVPGELTAGSEEAEDGREIFYDVRHGEKAVAIHLHGGNYRRLVVEVDGMPPDLVAKIINDAAAKARARAMKAEEIRAELA